MGYKRAYSMLLLLLLVPLTTGSPQPRLVDPVQVNNTTTISYGEDSMLGKLMDVLTSVCMKFSRLLQLLWSEPEENWEGKPWEKSEQGNFSEEGNSNWPPGDGNSKWSSGGGNSKWSSGGGGNSKWSSGGGKSKFSSWPKEPLLKEKYKAKGRLLMLDETMQAYQIGTGSKMVVWAHGIFGLTGPNSDNGRTKEWADYLADSGYNVLVPDWYRGNNMPGGWFGPDTPAWLLSVTNRTNILSDWETVIHPYLTAQSPSSIGLVGTCWGSYPVIHLSKLGTVSAGVSMHPSHVMLLRNAGEDMEQVLGSIQSPQLFLLERDAEDTLKVEGVSGKVLGDNLTVVEFPDMEHGWTVRGDLEDPKVERDVKKAKEIVVDFLEEHLI